jgi:hypothetical protein
MAQATKLDQQNFEQMWRDVQGAFEKKTKRSLIKGKKMSLQETEQFISSKLDSDDSLDSPRKQQVKRLTINTLKLVQLLGGIAAQV